MHFNFSLILLTFLIGLLVNRTQAQFWRLNNLSVKDQFIMETKASMSSGICYTKVPSKFNNPALKFQTLSHCCPGYHQNPASSGIKCEPICGEDCTNGVCSAPDVCECYPGFEREDGRCQIQDY